MKMMMNNMTDDQFKKINCLISSIEINLKKCSKKFKDKQEVDYLLIDLTNFLAQENISELKLQDEIGAIEKNLRKINQYNENSRRKLNDYREKIRNLNIELKSIKTLLEKSSYNWVKFQEAYELIRKWLEEQELISDLSKTDLNNYQRYQKHHAQFCESANFILQASDLSTNAKIKEKLLYLNKKWKIYQDRFKDTQYDQFLKYYECEQSLNMIMERLTKIECLTQKQCKCNLVAVSKYQEELQKAFNDVECLDANLKLLEKLITRLDLRHDPSLHVNDLYEGIRSSTDKLNRIRHIMPEFLRNLTKTCTQISSIEDGLQQIEFWCIEGENFLKSEPDQLSFDQILKHLDKQKKHFNEYTYHENSVVNKLHSLQGLRAVAPVNFDFGDLVGKLSKVKEILLGLNSRRIKWEEMFQAQQSLWRNFHQKTKRMEEWIVSAQKIVSEKNDDYNFLLHKHKEFFENVDKQLINDFLQAGEPLLNIKNESDITEIKILMDTLSGQWQMILAHAPVRLLKLQFKRLEVLLKQELKAADIEISEECLALKKNGNVEEILKRHEAKFKNSNFFSTCESYLQGLRNCSKELCEKKQEEKSNLDEILEYLQSYWVNLTKKIETMNAKLTILPETKESFETNFNQFAAWLYQVELNLESLKNNNLASLSDYRRSAEKCQSALQESDTKHEQFAVLNTQYEYLLQQNILGNEVGNQLKQLKNRYLRIVESELVIQSRIEYIEHIIIIAHNSDALANKIRNLSALSARRFMAEEDENSISTAIHEHHTVIDQMRLFEKEIKSLKEEACRISDNNLLHMPVAIYEKIVSTQDLIKQNLSEEIERQASLVEIKRSGEQQSDAMEQLNRNLDEIMEIMSAKNPEILDPIEPDLKNTDSYEDEKINSNHMEYSKYLHCLARSKELIQASKKLINDLKQPVLNTSIDLDCTSSSNLASFHQIRDIELHIDQFCHEANSQIDAFEANIAAHAKLERQLDKLTKDLEALKENFRMYKLKSTNQDETTKESIENLELEYDKLRIDMEHINKLKCELNAFHYDKIDLIKSNGLNLKHSREDSLCQGFCETINRVDNLKACELNGKLDEISGDVSELEEECLLKISDYKFRIEKFKMDKNQSKLNSMKSSLNLELDNLVNFKYFNEEDDLLIESEDILLDKIEADDAHHMGMFFCKTTEIDIEEECFKDESNFLENIGCVDVRVSRECLETNYNTSMDGESLNMTNKENQVLRNSAEVADRSMPGGEADMTVMAVETDQSSLLAGNKVSIVEDSSELSGVQIEIERELLLKKCVTFAVSVQSEEEMISSGSEEKATLEETLKQKELSKLDRNKDRTRLEVERIEKERERLESLRLEQEKITRERILKQEWEKLEAERNYVKEQEEILLREKADLEKKVKMDEVERRKCEEVMVEKKRLEEELMRKESLKKEREKDRQRQELDRIDKEKDLIQKRLEKQRVEKEKLEVERLERERFLKEKEKAEQKRIEVERLEMERKMKEREVERQEMERLVREKERLDAERAEREKRDREELEKKRLELEEERKRIEVEDNERIKKELTMEMERKERERIEKERLLKQESERVEKERAERERLEKVIESQREEKELISKQLEHEKQKLEFEKRQLEIERFERARFNEHENMHWERQEQQRIEWERQQVFEQQMLHEQQQLQQQRRLPAVLEETEEENRTSLGGSNLGSPYGSRGCSPVKSRSISPVKFKSRDNSPIKSRSASPVKSILKNSFIESEVPASFEVKTVYRQDLEDDQETLGRYLNLTEQQIVKRKKTESDLKDLCDNFNILKEKISQIGEFNQSHAETKLLIANLETELRCLNTEMDDLLITCGLSLDSVSTCNGLDQATLTQFDLIKSFSSYLAQQLDDKSCEYQLKLNQTAHVKECEKNLIKYIELALKFYKPVQGSLDWLEKDLNIRPNTSDHDYLNYVQSLSDLEDRISSIESIEDSIGNCLKQMGGESCSSSGKMNLSRILIEANILQPLSTHCADLKNFLVHWKQFERDFSKLKAYLTNEINMESLLKSVGDLGAELEARVKTKSSDFLEKDLKKLNSLREKLMTKVSQMDYLFSQGSALFEQTVGQQRVMAPNAAKEFNEVRENIKEACRFLDDKCLCLEYILKCEEKIKDMTSCLNKMTCDLDELEDGRLYAKELNSSSCMIGNDMAKTEQYLVKAKGSLERLAELKARFKVVEEEKYLHISPSSANTLATAATTVGVRSSINSSSLEALNRKFNYESRQKLEKLFNAMSIRFANLEVQYQEEIMKTLPSRSALNELISWLYSRMDLVDSLSTQKRAEEGNSTSSTTTTTSSLDKLEGYKKKLVEISDEMKQGRGGSLKFIRNSIEDEIKQGFYDLTVSELLSKTERDWTRFRQRISNELERLELSLIRINEFDRNVRQMQVWIQSQAISEPTPVESTPNHSFLVDEMKSINVIDDDKKILAQINNYKELLSRLEVIWQQERNELNGGENSTIGQLVQDHMSANLDELKSNLQSMELISKLKIENNLSSLKHTYTVEMNELNAALESEVNFINIGKIVSRQQYETTIKKISSILKKIHEARSKMHSILNKFDAELRSSQFDLSCNQKLNHHDVLSIAKNTIDSYDTTGFLENLKKNTQFNLSSLHMEKLENNANNIVSQAHSSILPVWVKYDEAYQCLQAKINETNRSYLNDLECIEAIDVSNSSLFQDKLKEMMENRRIFEQFNTTSNYLIEKFAPNENTKSQLKVNKQSLHDQFEKLSNLAERLKTKFESSLKEHQTYTRLINETNALNEEATKLINVFAIDKLNKNKSLHIYVEKFDSCERHLTEILDKFKRLNIKDTERISRIYETTNPSSGLLLKLREARMSLMNCVQERQSIFEAKLNDIERYLNNYISKRVEEATLCPELLNNVNKQQTNNLILNKNLTKLVNCLKYMLANNISLSKYDAQLEELMKENNSINHDSLYSKAKSLRFDLIAKARKQIELISQSPNGLYDNLTSLCCLNEQMNTALEQKLESNVKNVDKFREFNESFHSIKSRIEKNMFELQEKGLGFVDFRAMKAHCLEPIENFYVRFVADLESLSGKMDRYSVLAHKLEGSLKDVETKFMNKIEFSMSRLDGIIQKNNLDASTSNTSNDFENMESRLNYLKSIKQFLTGAQLKTDIEILQQLGGQLHQRGMQQRSQDCVRIKYLDLVCKIDGEIKELEQEFAKWKAIVGKSTKLLDLIRATHEQLAKISLANNGRCDRINSTEINNQSYSFNTSEILNGFEELSSNNLEYRIELKENKSLCQLIDFLKFEVLGSLLENETVKQELIELSSQSTIKSCSIRTVVDNVLEEWRQVMDKTNHKICKLERFKKTLTDLDTKLNKVREEIFNWEAYLNQEWFDAVDLVNFQTIMSKRAELEGLLKTMEKKETDTQHLFKVCLNANRHNLNGSRQNQQLILNLKERWCSLKAITKDKLMHIQSLWMLLTDLNDQMENFYLVLEKTETFYRHTCHAGNNPRVVFKLIQELYFTIQDDFKLIKYLNESFVNFSKLAGYFALYELLNKLKEKFMSLSNAWDNLHNEIAVEIKNSRKYENQMCSNRYGLTKESIGMWVSEISLLITNLEYLSTNELRMKFNDIVDIKSEICEQTEIIFKNENILKNDDELIEKIKQIMKRIIRLDSYLQRSSISTGATGADEGKLGDFHHQNHNTQTQFKYPTHQTDSQQSTDAVFTKPDYIKSFESLF